MLHLTVALASNARRRCATSRLESHSRPSRRFGGIVGGTAGEEPIARRYLAAVLPLVREGTRAGFLECRANRAVCLQIDLACDLETEDLVTAIQPLSAEHAA